MKIEECKALQSGDQVYINIGNGWIQTMTFLRMIKTQSLGRMTFSELLTADLVERMKNAKYKWEALCEYTDDRGKRQCRTYSIRALHKVL